MTVKQKILVGAIGAFVVLLLMLLWAIFAWSGKTPIDPLINQIGALITIVVGLIAAFFGHQSAAVRAPAPDVVAVPGDVTPPPVVTLPYTVRANAVSSAPAAAAATVADASTLQ